ncbi:sugar transferase [Butyrivibrio sp. CB08]|uniref:sugar transferase n=1 Tax=Butyrivibrio sp. CB08 TaxID=2364879 RepID=UPI000EA94849|nr:sugar transferase [Butyrivibrio sp. CB08]RKM57901.1 sugar transferase [Butyrivibrio sp. CB08]
MKKMVPPTSRRNSKYLYRYVCAAVFVLISALLFLPFWIPYVKGHYLPTDSLLGLGNLAMSVGLYGILYLIVGRWLHAFKIGVERKSNVLASHVLTLLTVNFLGTLLSSAISGQFRYYFDLVKMYAGLFFVQALINCVISIPMIDVYRKLFPPLKLLEIFGHYENDLSERLNGVYHKYQVVDRISAETDESALKEYIKQYDAVILNDLDSHTENRMIKICFEIDARVYYVPKLSDIIVKSAEELNQIDAPLFLNRNNGIGPITRFAKRFFDIILSFIALIVLSPLMLIVALLIHLEDGGPVFYKQERVTLCSKRFMIIKFRSMIVDAERDGTPRPAGQDDDRITKIGKFIRKVRIDELPQLINIIKGDMSIVGPRPERWEHVEKYTQEIPEFSYRLKMKAGLTGYAQVYGKYNTTALDKLKLDLCYITNYSLLLDLQIIFETIKILLHKDSTEGFTEKNINEMRN